MLPYLTRTFHLPPVLTYIVVLGALALGCVIAGFVLHRVFHRWARCLQGAWSEVTVEMLESLALPLLIVGAFDIALESLSLPPRYDRFAGRLVLAIVLGVVFNFLSRVVALLFRGVSRRDPGFLRITQPATLVVRIVFGFLALIIFLENIGVSLTAVWTTLGVGSVAIGLALQATLSNFFAGLNILADRAVSPGDHIKLSTGVEGEVVRIGWRATELRTAGDEITLVPNSTMASANITNYSLPGLGAMVSLTVKVKPAGDIAQVEKILADTARGVAAQFNGASTAPNPEISFNSAFGDPFWQFSLKLPVAEASKRDAVAGALRKEIADRYREGKLQGP
jgi:small-conductance mechanosensitive channel